jgi:signal peptidase I
MIEESPEPKKRISWTRHMIGALIALPIVTVFILMQTGIFQPYRIVSASMEPTLQVGDALLTRPPRNVTDWHHRIVIFPDPTKPEEDLIKRVVGVGGDQMEFRRGRLYRNNDPQPLTSLGLRAKAQRWNLDVEELFVLGDNDLDSYDSLNFGPIKVTDVKAVPFYRYWPRERRGKLE